MPVSISLPFNIKKQSKKIVFGITKLDLGGAERVLVDLCNNLCNEYEITIFTIYAGGVLESELNPLIKTVSLFDKQSRLVSVYLFVFGKHIYNKFIKDRFDTEIGFLEGPITRLFAKFHKSGKNSFNDNSNKDENSNNYKYVLENIKIIINNKKSKHIAFVHNDIRNVFGRGIKANLKKHIDKKYYKKYDLIIFVSEDNKNCFNEQYGNDFNEMVIYNYIDKKRVIKLADEKIDDVIYKDVFEKNENSLLQTNSCKTPTILTVARLTEQKAIDRFIKIHKRLIDDGIKHKVCVIGEGKERGLLQKLIKDLNVKDTFILLGEKKNPYPYFKKSDIFALLSLYEGYGMVIEEAKIFNLPIIITNTAAKEAVQGYRKAIIAENNEDDIYLALKSIIGDLNYYDKLYKKFDY